MKTPEELEKLKHIKELYKTYFNQDIPSDIEDAYLWAFEQTQKLPIISWLIYGYKAGEKYAQLKNAAAYSHGSDVQKIASEYLKNKGIDGALLPYAENRFIDGYLVAKKHAHAALEEAEARHQEYVDKTEANFKELEAKIAELQAK